MRFYVDLPDPDAPGKFICLGTPFETREEAAQFCASWGAVDGKLDLITEVPQDTDEEVSP